MTELLEVYDLQGKLLKVQERSKFYSGIKKEYASKGRISKQVRAVRILLLNSRGRIYLQKRSKLKNENPGLYDKTIGGHVSKGETWDMAAIRECAEELGFPASILSPEEFDRAIHVTDLSVVGIFRKVDYIPSFQSVRVTADGERFVQPFITTVYIGYYDGAIKFVDGESSGVEVFSLDELKGEIKSNPSKFTEDLKYMVKAYGKYVKPVSEPHVHKQRR
ncbi:MAG: NUDIX hydrolase [archaeon]|nr:NUDIX hydrolase [archaeon]